jgi:hypothetical protein
MSNATDIIVDSSQNSDQSMDHMQMLYYYQQYYPYGNYFPMPSVPMSESLSQSNTMPIQSAFPSSNIGREVLERPIPPVPSGGSNKIVWVGSIPPDSTEKELLVYNIYVICIYFY